MQIKIKLTLAERIFINDVHDKKYVKESRMCTKMMEAGLVEYQYGQGQIQIPVILTKVGQLAWEQNQPKVEKSKDPVYPLCVDYWLKQFHPGFLFGGVQGKALQSLINKIRSISTNPTDETVVATFQKLCQLLPEWYKTKDLPVIDSKFNEIVAEIQKGPVKGYNQMNSAERMFFGTE